MNLAPVIIFCYNRPFHVKRLVESLLKNPLSKHTHLFFFSDGYKGTKDKEDIELVRKVISEVSGFRQIDIIERPSNFGLANSVINGVSQVIKEYERVIVLEDDLLVSSDFLEFMNKALDFYKEDRRIYSVSGFKFPFDLPKTYNKEVYLLPRICSLGWGTWGDRWNQANWEMNYFPEFIEDGKQRMKYEQGGENLTLILLKQYLGYYQSWATRWDYNRFVNEAYCLYPVYPKVINTGNDGSGTNDSIFIRVNKILSNKPVRFIAEIAVDSEIVKNAKVVFKLSIVKKIYFRLLMLQYFFLKLRQK